MSAEIPEFSINGKSIDVHDSLQALLLGGYAIESYMDRVVDSNNRVVNVAEAKGSAAKKTYVGRGEDRTVEAALVRSLLTFHESQLLNTFPTDILEHRAGEIAPDLTTESQLDKMIQDGVYLCLALNAQRETFSARLYGHQVGEPIELDSDDPVDAVESITHWYHFRHRSGSRTMRLPVTLFRP